MQNVARGKRWFFQKFLRNISWNLKSLEVHIRRFIPEISSNIFFNDNLTRKNKPFNPPDGIIYSLYETRKYVHNAYIFLYHLHNYNSISSFHNNSFHFILYCWMIFLYHWVITNLILHVKYTGSIRIVACIVIEH